MSHSIQLIVGLGNPGKEYQNTRHNLGFMVIDRIVQELHLTDPTKNAHYQLWVWKTDHGDKVMFMQPLTFMNNSGEIILEVMRFFKIGEENLTVIQDDLDLDLGLIRLRKGGGSGGHNGIASIQQHLGHDDFKRIKLGINRPPEQMPAEAYVLQPFSESDQETVASVVDEASTIVVELAKHERSFEEKTVHITKQ